MMLLIVLKDSLYKNLNNNHIVKFEEQAKFNNILNNKLAKYLAISASAYQQNTTMFEELNKNFELKIVEINSNATLISFLEDEVLI